MNENKIIRIGFLFLFIVLVVLSFFSEGSGYGGGDSSMHMMISKFSIRHPELFLHLWGKPFFILFSCLFAEFGFVGMNLFNILCALSTAFLIYLLAKEFRFENSRLAIFFSLFAPIYFVVIFSGLTEVFFSFVLVLSVFLFVQKKYLLSSAIVSFLPFVRSEGYLLLLLFCFVLVYRKKFIAVFFLVLGTLVYSIIGGIHYHDLLWTIHQNPYAGANHLYGNGSLFFFVRQNEFILGSVLVILSLLGIAGFFIRRKEKEKFFNSVSVEEAVLLYGSFAVYFIAHSVFWWKGWFGSDGLIRVMAGVTPLLALLMLRGANLILSFNNSAILQSLIVTLVIAMPFKQHHFPRHFDYEEATLHQADHWIMENYLESGKIIYAHPFVTVELGKDPFNDHSTADFYSLKKDEPETTVSTGELVIWDSHFSPNEGGIPLQQFQNNKNFRMLNSFSSDMAVTPKDKGRFEVYIFRRN